MRIVADVGNSRLKWARLMPDGNLCDRIALPLDDLHEWQAAFDCGKFSPQDAWSISTVHPEIASRLRAFLGDCGVRDVRWYESAADVPVPHRLPHPEKAGADRALAVLAALKLAPRGEGGLVVSCGTAITVERITKEGIWEGGAIAPGLSISAAALNRQTAQLPLVNVGDLSSSWGNATETAMAAGLFWGTVGAVRELIVRQEESACRWVLWTGGDAARLAPHVEGESAQVFPDLVLLGLASTVSP